MNPAQWITAMQDGQGVGFALLRTVASVLAAGFGLGLVMRELLFSWRLRPIYRLSAPVISLGNLTAGGTGKTPATIWLAKRLMAQGGKPVLLSRGYGGDEERLLARLLPDIPHLAGRNRVELGRQAIATWGSKIVLLLDDGFQHRRLARDLDILLVDATCPWGFDHLLPRGFLRDLPQHAKRAKAILLTRTDQVSFHQRDTLRNTLARLANPQVIAESRHRPCAFRHVASGEEVPCVALAHQPLAIFCGIGNPAAFRVTLETLSMTIVWCRYYPDHHPYTPVELRQIKQEALRCGAQAIVTTAKDAARLTAAVDFSLPCWTLEIELEVTVGEKELLKIIEEQIKPPAIESYESTL